MLQSNYIFLIRAIWSLSSFVAYYRAKYTVTSPIYDKYYFIFIVDFIIWYFAIQGTGQAWYIYLVTTLVLLIYSMFVAYVVSTITTFRNNCACVFVWINHDKWIHLHKCIPFWNTFTSCLLRGFVKFIFFSHIKIDMRLVK